ncbi:MAG: hypothetical protein QXX08_09420 [Candidatus Bathyarchaeia archaeon]
MGRFLTNILISTAPCFSEFKCLKAPLTVDEKEAWRERHSYLQPMAPFKNELFFVSMDENIPFIDGNAVQDVTLTCNQEEDYKILRFLVKQALKIQLEKHGFQSFRNFYSHNRYMTTIIGRFNVPYDVFLGITPTISFKQGYCLISLKPGAKIFTQVKSVKDVAYLEQKFFITLCNLCPESSACENTQHKVSRYVRANKRMYMVDITGKAFDCPSSMVRVESSPRDLRGEYGRILERTAPRTSKEYEFLSQLINEISEKDILTLNLGVDVTFSKLVIGGANVE